MNIEHFNELTEQTQKELIDYIKSHYSIQKSFNHKGVSSYSLKQHFISTFKTNNSEHITNRCFKEAMEYCGFKSKQIEHQDDYIFNVRILKSSF